MPKHGKRYKAQLEQVEKELNPRASESRELKAKATRVCEAVEVTKKKLAQLESDKKGAIQSKNFMLAKTITQQLKELQEQLRARKRNLRFR